MIRLKTSQMFVYYHKYNWINTNVKNRIRIGEKFQLTEPFDSMNYGGMTASANHMVVRKISS